MSDDKHRAVMPLPPHKRTLPVMLARQAERFGSKPLLTIAGRSWTHRDAADAASRRAERLREAGVEFGERVALMCSNRIEFLECFLGCGWLGVVSVPINTAAMGPQIEYCLANSGARLLVIEHEFLPRLEMADLSRTALRAVWVVAAETHGELPLIGALPCLRYPDPDQAIDPAQVGPGDTLSILYTSGTTGPAKGVICPHAQYHWWGVHTARVLGIEAHDVLCTTLPLFHANALNTFAQAAVTGASAVFEARFSASGFWESMRAADATVIYVLGAMVPILLAQPPSAAERGHRVRVGLGPGVPAAAIAAFRERTGTVLLEGYGSTETNFAIGTAIDSPRTGVMGWLREGFDARVVDENDVELPPGEAGELVLRADEPFAFANGYFGMPEATVRAWRNLWFHTGDRVVRDADGAFRFIDRIKDAIRRRGENISSYEVEQVLLGHPAVASAAVYPVRSELAEDEVMAALVIKEGARVDLNELVRYCELRLPHFAVPLFIEVMDDLPRTESGKVQKYKLRERGVSASTWERVKAAGAPATARPPGG
ncbi:MAG: ATP-dependent acyl-CoA ligase [Burkholderiaceae bacterium]|nr:ATP-dependent acyl-CoA ligase [Burkholderiaceae bacterium]